MRYLPGPKDVEFSTDISVLKLALKNKIWIPTACGGMGSCGTCLVRVLEGGEKLPPRDELEIEMVTDRAMAADERLSCQIHACAGLVVQIVNDDLLDDDDEDDSDDETI